MQQPARAQASVLQVSPTTAIAAEISKEGKADAQSFHYALRASNGSVRFLI